MAQILCGNQAALEDKQRLIGELEDLLSLKQEELEQLMDQVRLSYEIFDNLLLDLATTVGVLHGATDN